MTHRNFIAALGGLPFVLALPGCGKGKKASTNDITPEFQKFLAEAKNDKGELFYSTKPIAELPADLKWEDGMEQEDLGSPQAKKGGTYHHYLPDYPRTLRHLGESANDHIRSYVVDYFFLPLVHRHPDSLEQIPALAKQWARDKDGRTFYFKLDPEARFSDGEAVRADNFAFMFFFMRSDYHGDLWYQEEFRKKYEKMVKFDDQTFSVTYWNAKPDALYRASSITPLPIAFFKNYGKDFLQEYNWKFVPSPGPYEVKPEGLKKGQSVTLTKVKNWWAKDRKFYRNLFNPDRIQLDIVRDPDKLVEVFKNEENDVFRIRSAEQWHQKVADNDPLVEAGYIHKGAFYNQTPRPTYGFYINTSKPLLNNRDVRQGLHHACNWDLVCQQVFRGDYDRLNYMQEGFGEYSNPAIKARPFDPAKAAEFFAKAGFTERDEKGIFKNAQGQRLAFTITNSYKRFEAALVVIQQEARKAGVDLAIETPEATAAWKKLNEKKHDLGFTAFNINVEMYPRFWEDFHSSNAFKPDGSVKTDTNNFTQTNDKEIDALIDRYDKSESAAEMKQLAFQLEQKLHDEAAFVPAWAEVTNRVAYWRWVKFPESFDVRTSRDFEEWWLFWIDEEERKATEEAMKAGKTFPKTVRYYEQWRTKA